jgi:hypothetical protein
MVLLLHRWLFLACASMLHPLFVSVTEINHNPKDKTLEISCKAFADDLEKAIEKTSNVKLDLFEIKDKNAANKGVTDYFRKHLVLKVDGKLVQMEFVGFEREGDAIWSYFQVSNITSLKKLDVANNILYEVSPDETNLMHVTVNSNRKSMKLDYPDVNAVFEF